MTYIEHDRDCKVFKDRALAYDNGICNCHARFARYTPIMGPHEQSCPYLEPLGKAQPGVVTHGICYCSADPHHDETCTEETCPFWKRRTGVVRIMIAGGILVMPPGMVA